MYFAAGSSPFGPSKINALPITNNTTNARPPREPHARKARPLLTIDLLSGGIRPPLRRCSRHSAKDRAILHEQPARSARVTYSVSADLPSRFDLHRESNLPARNGPGGDPSAAALTPSLPIASSRSGAIGVRAFDAGEPAPVAGAIVGRFEAAAGTSALLVLAAAHQEPIVFPSRDELAARLDATCASRRRWTGGRSYEGPWREAVIRSALALKLLVYAPPGAIAAAATASLPEETRLGGYG